MAADAAVVRALIADGTSITTRVAAIIAAVRAGGDAALRDHIERFDGTGGASVLVEPGELDAALAALDPAVRAGLEVAVENVGIVARAGLAEPKEVTLPQGHRVTLREVPVRRAAIYAPGGSPYPSSVVMGAVTARAAGVEDVVVCAGGAHPVMLAACALCEVDTVYRMGGAHAVAALAYGTETIRRVDVIAGPGALYGQEAKRQVSGVVGIDGFFGPSDVLVLAGSDGNPNPALILFDLLAQAEHGSGTLVVLCTDDPELLDAIEPALREGPDTGAVAVTVLVDGPAAALAFAEAFAPEHLELMGQGMEPLAADVRSAGCVFVGPSSGTAFGDYVAGSNHCLPTQGAARFASTLNVRHFRRRMSEVRIGDAAAALAAAGAPVARAENLDLHAVSMQMRQDEAG